MNPLAYDSHSPSLLTVTVATITGITSTPSPNYDTYLHLPSLTTQLTIIIEASLEVHPRAQSFTLVCLGLPLKNLHFEVYLGVRPEVLLKVPLGESPLGVHLHNFLQNHPRDVHLMIKASLTTLKAKLVPQCLNIDHEQQQYRSQRNRRFEHQIQHPYCC